MRYSATSIATMGALLSSPVHLDYTEFFMNSGNIEMFDYANVTKGFQNSICTNVSVYSAPDWTQPYPGTILNGFTARLNISSEIAGNSSAENLSTVMASLTFGVPYSLLLSSGEPKAMDPSWSVCRHVFVSTKPSVQNAIRIGGGTRVLLCRLASNMCHNRHRIIQRCQKPSLPAYCTTVMVEASGYKPRGAICKVFVGDLEEKISQVHGSTKKHVYTAKYRIYRLIGTIYQIDPVPCFLSTFRVLGSLQKAYHCLFYVHLLT